MDGVGFILSKIQGQRWRPTSNLWSICKWELRLPYLNSYLTCRRNIIQIYVLRYHVTQQNNLQLNTNSLQRTNVTSNSSLL